MYMVTTISTQLSVY